MTAYLLIQNRQRKTGEKICTFLKANMTAATLFTRCDEFWASVALSEKGQIDFVLIDFSLYQMDVFNPYKEMQRMTHPVPVVLYNDPYPRKNERAVFWKIKNMQYFPAIMTSEKTSALVCVWKKLEHFLNTEANPYVSVIREPQDPDTEYSAPLPEPAPFCRRHGLSASRERLFSFFLQNIGISLSEAELEEHLWEEKSRSHTKSLYTYIHEIRGALQKEPSLGLSLEHDGKERYVLKRAKACGKTDFLKAEEFFIQKKKYHFEFKKM